MALSTKKWLELTYQTYSDASEREVVSQSNKGTSFSLFTHLQPVLCCFPQLVFYLFAPYVLIAVIIMIIMDRKSGVEVDFSSITMHLTISFSIVSIFIFHYVLFRESNFGKDKVKAGLYFCSESKIVKQILDKCSILTSFNVVSGSLSSTLKSTPWMFNGTN